MPDLESRFFAHCITFEYWKTEFISGSNIYRIVYDSVSHINQRNFTHDYSCNCEAYKFGKGKHCKHIKEARKKHCRWSQFLSGNPPVNNKCPMCGSEIKFMAWGV